MTTDVFTTEIIKDSLVAIGEEMFNAVIRTSMSPIIYETTDFAVGVTDANGICLARETASRRFSQPSTRRCKARWNTIPTQAISARET